MTISRWMVPMISLILIAVVAYYTSFTVSSARKLKVELADKVNFQSPDVDSAASDDRTPPSALLERRLPTALIIGVRKCGTRALLDFLETHPAVRTAREEVHFFDQKESSFKRRGLDWYRAQMPESSPGQLTLEKTPGYFNYPGVPKRVHDMSSSTRLILVVRDPVTRLISDYAQYRAHRLGRNLTTPTFQAFVTTHDGHINSAAKSVRVSIYVHFLLKWTQWFHSGQIHVVDGDRLVRDPYAEMKLVERFLSLDDYFRSAQFIYRPERGFYCVRPDGEGGGAGRDDICLGASKGRNHPHVEKRLLEQLRAYFEPYNQQFYAAVRKRFNWTTTATSATSV